jgi:hypothetical protein
MKYLNQILDFLKKSFFKNFKKTNNMIKFLQKFLSSLKNFNLGLIEPRLTNQLDLMGKLET